MATLTTYSSKRLGNGRATDGFALRPVAQVVGFAALIAIAARVKFFAPGLEVPITLQTLAVLLCGFFLPPARAMAAVVVYLIAGLVGAPVFAALELGVKVVTLGYLIGFIAAAGIVSFSVRSALRPMGFAALMSVATVGTGIIFLFGVTWIALLRGDLGIAIGAGLLPFVPWAVVKTIAAAMIASAAPSRWVRS